MIFVAAKQKMAMDTVLHTAIAANLDLTAIDREEDDVLAEVEAPGPVIEQ